MCVGLSGGCDSVVLLHVLSQLGLAGRLSALHVHHGLSPNATQWAAFCTQYCRDLSIPLQVCHVVVPRNSASGLEAAARTARYGALVGSGAEVIVLAHHRGDQAETVLFNMLRGAGVMGATGMPPVRALGEQRLMRPLLGVGRQEIEAYAGANQLCWVDDESNGDAVFSRNFLRLNVMPVIQSRFPGAEGALALAASHFAEANILLDEMAVEDWARVSDGEPRSVSVKALRGLSALRLANLLRHRLRGLGWRMPDASRLDEFVRQVLTAAPDRHPQLVLAEGRMQVAGRRLHWLPEK